MTRATRHVLRRSLTLLAVGVALIAAGRAIHP